jgi:hypothetical protein
MNKRAIELQFHWIFILIAGAVILAFFFSVVQKQRALSEEKLSITLSTQMDAIFAGAIESKGTTQSLATPQPGIAFACSDVCECNYYIGDKATEFRDKILFAPALIADEDAIAWAHEWAFPFRVTNFLMLTSPAIKYYLVYEDSDPQSTKTYARISKALPKEINRQTYTDPSAVYHVSPQGYAHTRFVFLGTKDKPNLRDLPLEYAEESVSAVWIDPDFRTAVFSEKSDDDELDFNERPTSLAGDASAYAAVFAADRVLYDCMMRRAFDKLGIIADVHARRATRLRDTLENLVPPRLECGLYQDLIPELATVAQKATLLGATFPEPEDALRLIASSQGVLQTNNNNLLLQSCPELY